LAHLTDIPSLTFTAASTAAVVTTHFPFATAGILAGDRFSRRHVRGPNRAIEAGHAGVAKSVASGGIRAAEVGRQLAKRFTETDALGVAVEVFTEGLIGGADEFHPLRSICATSVIGRVIQTIRFAWNA